MSISEEKAKATLFAELIAMGERVQAVVQERDDLALANQRLTAELKESDRQFQQLKWNTDQEIEALEVTIRRYQQGTVERTTSDSNLRKELAEATRTHQALVTALEKQEAEWRANAEYSRKYRSRESVEDPEDGYYKLSELYDMHADAIRAALTAASLVPHQEKA